MSSELTLYTLLKKGKVVIPLIQRDYAQGRKEKQFVLSQFLSDIKEHFDTNTPLFLDFIYGSRRDNYFQPLDGQQRLSTLWLFHWYISFKSGRLDSDKDILKNFSYETRSSSRTFCTSLCLYFNAEGYSDGKNLVDYIKSQNWFYSAWLQDPTVSSMLRALGGGNDSDTISISSVFKDVDFEEYWKKLYESDFVSFKLLYIGTEQLPVSDDLYIKINARGKQLTHLENFKADLLDWIKRNKDGDDDFYFLYSSYLDNELTQVFWDCIKERSGTHEFDGNIDAPFLAFIDRYFLCLHCVRSNENSSSFAGGNDKDFSTLHNYLIRNKKTKKVELRYEEFDAYGKDLTITDLDLLRTIISNIRIGDTTYSDKEINNLINRLNTYDVDLDSEETGNYVFVPDYDNIESNESNRLIKPTTLKELVYFWAICRFLSQDLESDRKELQFRDWIRVSRNIIENAAIENIPRLVDCLRFIDDLASRCSGHSWNVIECLTNEQFDIPNSALGKQISEEIQKAKIIVANPAKKTIICDAENYSFFNGTIRFLYQDESGNIDVQLTNFDQKFANAKQLFNSDSKQNISLSTIKRFLSLFASFDELIDKNVYTSIGYHNRNSCWKNDILCSDDSILASCVHKLLMNEPQVASSPFASNSYSSILNKIYNDSENYKYRYFEYYGLKYLRKEHSANQVIYLGQNRKTTCDIVNRLVSNGQITLIDPTTNVYLDGFYWGKKLLIRHSNKDYCITQENDTNNDVSVLYTYVDENLKDKLGKFSTEQELLALLNQ